MASKAEISQLRARAASVLSSSTCQKIRFKLDNIAIQTFMYSYVAGLIRDDHVHINIGSGNGYDYISNTITYDSLDVSPKAIVHEATHVVIDATNPGKEVTKGTHEAAAYLAESIYALLCGDQPETDVKNLTQPVAALARKVVAFNKSNASGLFPCPLSDSEYIKKVLASSQLSGDQGRGDKQDGVPYRSGGLIRQMWLDSR